LIPGNLIIINVAISIVHAQDALSLVLAIGNIRTGDGDATVAGTAAAVSNGNSEAGPMLNLRR
jgi:hypothetical protein